jgi:hypothetical protein
MKKLILLIVLCLGAKSFAQTNGITYQAVILNPNGEQLPGVNNTNAPMVDKNICMQFQFIDAFAKLEYQETIQTKTDSFGMVNLVIGSGKQTAGYAASFQSIEWNALKKSMIVSINTSGSCSSFTEISNQPFTAVPFAFSAINSGNVTGVVAIENGGTNAITIIGAKINLGLEKLDNTSDLDKPMSIAAQARWNINASAISEEVSTARAAELALTTNLATEATAARAAEGVNTTAISDEVTRATDAETVLATAISDETTRAGLAEVANATAVSSKEDKINKSIDGTFASNSDVLFPTEKATKTYVDAQVTTATTGNFVNLTTDQNVSEKKIFNDDLNVNGQADLSMLRVNGFADIRDAFFTGSIFDVLSDATFSGMRFDVMGDAMFGGNINNLGNITSNSFIKNNGLSTQYLMADGSVSTGGSGTTITEVADEFSATATQTVFTLT